MAKQTIRPYSRQYWLERQRRYAIESQQRRRVWTLAGIMVAGILGIGLLLIGMSRVPDDWQERLRIPESSNVPNR